MTAKLGVLQKRSILAVFLAAIFWLSPAAAHHSHGNYNMTQYTHLTGIVSELHWMNPHIWIYIDVPNDEGEVDIWSLEGASPTQVINSGWTRDSIEVGDEISVRCHQLWDGDTGCLLGFLTPQGGVEKEFD